MYNEKKTYNEKSRREVVVMNDSKTNYSVLADF